MLTRPTRDPALLIDRMAVEAEIDALAIEHEGNAAALRQSVVSLLRTTLTTGRAKAREWFETDRLGFACARAISHLEDEIIRATYAYVTR